jgi:hypothetical protein
MTFKDLVKKQTLSDTEAAYAEHLCKRPWLEFSGVIGKMNKADCLKILKHIVTKRPSSKTLGNRVVQRFNTLNKVRYEEVI